MKLSLKLIIVITVLSLGLVCGRLCFGGTVQEWEREDVDNNGVPNIDDHCINSLDYDPSLENSLKGPDGCPDKDQDGVRDILETYGGSEYCMDRVGGSIVNGYTIPECYKTHTVDECPNERGVGMDVKYLDRIPENANGDRDSNGSDMIDDKDTAIRKLEGAIFVHAIFALGFKRVSNGCPDVDCDGIKNSDDDDDNDAEDDENNYDNEVDIQHRVVNCPIKDGVKQCWWREMGGTDPESHVRIDTDCDTITDTPRYGDPIGDRDCPNEPGSRRGAYHKDPGCPEPAFQFITTVTVNFSALSEGLQHDEPAFEPAHLVDINWDAIRDAFRRGATPEPDPEPTPPPEPRRETPSPAPRTPSTTTPPTSTTTTQPTNFYREGELDTSDEENTVRTDDTNGGASSGSYGGCSLVASITNSGTTSLIILALSLMPIVVRRKA